MLKKIVVGALIVVVIGAVGVGIIDAAQGKTLAAQGRSVAAQAAAPSVAQDTAQTAVQPQGVGGGQGQGYRGGQNQSADQAATQDQGQGQGYRGGQGAGGQGQSTNGQGQTQNPNPGTPQANVTEWVTVTGIVNSFDGVGVSLTTDDGAPLWVQFGQSRYVTAQGVTFTAGDHLTVNGFYENGQYQAGTVINDTTGQTLNLRDSTGRPLWAGGPQR
jgi:hypothetical protein